MCNSQSVQHTTLLSHRRLLSYCGRLLTATWVNKSAGSFPSLCAYMHQMLNSSRVPLELLL